MEIRLIYREVPDDLCCAVLERNLKRMAPVQEAIDGGKRLWLSHVPDTMYCPLAKPRPFDILVGPARLSDDEMEAFRMGMGAIPKRCMVCRCHETLLCERNSKNESLSEDNTTVDILFAITFEIMTTTSALLCIDSLVLRQMEGGAFSWADDDDASLKSRIYRYPGQISEIAEERADGDLSVEWVVDSRWLRAWIDERNRKRGVRKGESCSRFATLDYI